MPMYKVDWEEAIKMRRAGASYKEIADRFGASRQWIHSKMIKLLPNEKDRRRGAEIYNNIALPGMRKLFAENPRLTIAGMRRIIFMGTMNAGTTHKQTELIRRMINGKDVKITIDAIRRLLDFSGMTFEELFGREEDG